LGRVRRGVPPAPRRCPAGWPRSAEANDETGDQVRGAIPHPLDPVDQASDAGSRHERRPEIGERSASPSAPPALLFRQARQPKAAERRDAPTSARWEGHRPSAGRCLSRTVPGRPKQTSQGQMGGGGCNASSRPVGNPPTLRSSRAVCLRASSVRTPPRQVHVGREPAASSAGGVNPRVRSRAVGERPRSVSRPLTSRDTRRCGSGARLGHPAGWRASRPQSTVAAKSEGGRAARGDVPGLQIALPLKTGLATP
jgi:hypothetical protein